MNGSKSVALRAVRSRAALLADAILRAERAQGELAVALSAAEDAGATQAEVDLQIGLAAHERPEREGALARLALLSRERE